jgi:hypothetical protein
MQDVIIRFLSDGWKKASKVKTPKVCKSGGGEKRPQGKSELILLLERLKGVRSFAERGANGERLKGIAHHLVEAENHHQREEEIKEALLKAMESRFQKDSKRINHLLNLAKAIEKRQLEKARTTPEGSLKVFQFNLMVWVFPCLLAPHVLFR